MRVAKELSHGFLKGCFSSQALEQIADCGMGQVRFLSYYAESRSNPCVNQPQRVGGRLSIPTRWQQTVNMDSRRVWRTYSD